MNKSFVKFLTDFGPLIIFFAIYYKSGNNLRVAIPPFIIATIVALLVVFFLEKKIPPIPLFSGILITLFGGLTIYFDNPVFLYIKPTIINLLFAFVLLFGKFFTNKPILKIFFKSYRNWLVETKQQMGNIFFIYSYTQ